MQVNAAKAIVQLMYEEVLPPDVGAADLVKVGRHMLAAVCCLKPGHVHELMRGHKACDAWLQLT
jgi:hypothetical protein